MSSLEILFEGGSISLEKLLGPGGILWRNENTKNFRRAKPLSYISETGNAYRHNRSSPGLKNELLHAHALLLAKFTSPFPKSSSCVSLKEKPNGPALKHAA